jgi:acetyl esterase/lipase
VTDDARAAIDRAYDNAAAFADVPQWRVTWQERSAAVPIASPARLDVPYGSRPAQKLDLFPCGDSAAPTVLFYHGGFWTRNGKETFRYVVRGIHAAGFNAIFVGYTLAPAAGMDEIVAEARDAASWTFGHLGELGFAPHRLVAVGWSAGAHLAAMTMGLACVGAGIGVSGVYDLAPMRLGSVNDALKLDAATAERNTPARHLPHRAGPFHVAYGARELPAYCAQSQDFHAAWATAGLTGELVPLAGHHHHSSLDDLYEETGVLVRLLSDFRSIVTS